MLSNAHVVILLIDHLQAQYLCLQYSDPSLVATLNTLSNMAIKDPATTINVHVCASPSHQRPQFLGK